VTGQLRIEDGTVSSKETPKSNLFSLDLLMHENSNAGKERKKAKGNSRGLYNLGATVYDIMIEAGSLSMTRARCLDPGVILTQLFKHSVISAPKRILSGASVCFALKNTPSGPADGYHDGHLGIQAMSNCLHRI